MSHKTGTSPQRQNYYPEDIENVSYHSLYANPNQLFNSSLSVDQVNPIMMEPPLEFFGGFSAPGTNAVGNSGIGISGISGFDEFANLSLESLPEIELDNTPDWCTAPYTPTVNDGNFSEASLDLTGHNQQTEFRPPKPSLAYTAQMHLQQFSGRQTNSDIPLMMNNNYQPHSPQLSNPNLHAEPQLGLSNTLPTPPKPQKFSPNLQIPLYQNLHTNFHQPPQHQPIIASHSSSSTSPLITQYGSFELNSPILPPRSFKNDSDSSFGSIQSDSPLRSKKSSKNLAKKPSITDLQKPKKHTRKRLLPRSKNGCWICRIKHLKCDERQPICKSCERFGIECDYSPEKPDYVSDKNLRKQKLADLAANRKPTSLSKKRSKRNLI